MSMYLQCSHKPRLPLKPVHSILYALATNSDTQILESTQHLYDHEFPSSAVSHECVQLVSAVSSALNLK